MKKYKSLAQLINDDDRARKYFNTLPGAVQEQLWQRAHDVDSFQSLCSLADHCAKKGCE